MSIYPSQKKYFEEAYRTGEHGWPVEGPSEPIVRFFERFKKEKKTGRVLDLGCGEGRHAALFAKAGYQTIGLDYQPQALTRASRLCGKNRARPHFIVGDLFHLPLAQNSFDLLIDYGCFHHVRKRDTALYLGIILSLLKPGGYLLLSCFSMRFKHHPKEKRKRDWLIHKGHYDRFFKLSSFRTIFGESFRQLHIEEEQQSLYAFFHVWMQKK
ncbi:MAG: class I SAM-dependent methyltransferase [Nitrospiria bacterium]